MLKCQHLLSFLLTHRFDLHFWEQKDSDDLGFCWNNFMLRVKNTSKCGDTFSLTALEDISSLVCSCMFMYVCLCMCLLRAMLARERKMRRKQPDTESPLPCLGPVCTAVHQYKWAGCESLHVLDWEQSALEYIPKFLISQFKILPVQNTYEIVVQPLCFTGPSSSFPHLLGLPQLLLVLDTSKRIFCAANAEHLSKGDGSFWKPPKRKQKGHNRVQTSQQAFPASCWWHQLVSCTRWWHSHGGFKENNKFSGTFIIKSVRSSLLPCSSRKRNFSCS